MATTKRTAAQKKRGASQKKPEKGPPKPQWRVRLDDYHRFVLIRFMELRGTDCSAIMGEWITAWVADHGETIGRARASLEDWDAIAETWVEAEAAAKARAKVKARRQRDSS